MSTKITLDAFEAYIHEDVSCEPNEVYGGLQEAELYYCYLPFVESLRTPSAIGSNNFAGTVSRDIVCKENYGFKKIKALVDTPKLSAEYSGSDSAQVEGFLLGTRSELVGFSRKVRHRPFVFIVKDKNNKQFILGNLVSPAYLKSFSMDTGSADGEDNGASFKFSSNSIIYEYVGKIPVVEKPNVGDFDSDFDSDFD